MPFWGCLRLTPPSLFKEAGLLHRPRRPPGEGQVPAGLESVLRSSKDAGPVRTLGCLGAVGPAGRARKRSSSGVVDRPWGGYACSAIRSYSDPIRECLLGIRHFDGVLEISEAGSLPPGAYSQGWRCQLGLQACQPSLVGGDGSGFFECLLCACLMLYVCHLACPPW